MIQAARARASQTWVFRGTYEASDRASVTVERGDLDSAGLLAWFCFQAGPRTFSTLDLLSSNLFY